MPTPRRHTLATPVLTLILFAGFVPACAHQPNPNYVPTKKASHPDCVRFESMNSKSLRQSMQEKNGCPLSDEKTAQSPWEIEASKPQPPGTYMISTPDDAERAVAELLRTAIGKQITIHVPMASDQERTVKGKLFSAGGTTIVVLVNGREWSEDLTKGLFKVVVEPAAP